MAKKLDGKAAALAAAQGSGAVFEALVEDVQAAPAADKPKADINEKQSTETPTMDTQTFTKAMGLPKMDMPDMDLNAVAERMRGMFDVKGTLDGKNLGDGKGLMERAQTLSKEAAELAKGNVEAMMASSRIAAQNAGTVSQEVAALGRKSFEGASEAMKGFAEAKSPVELLRLQSEFAKTYMETMFAEAAKLSETLVKLTGEALQPVQAQVAANVEKAKSITRQG